MKRKKPELHLCNMLRLRQDESILKNRKTERKAVIYYIKERLGFKLEQKTCGNCLMLAVDY